MRPKTTVGLIGLALLGSGAVSAVWAQQPQIPTLQVCNETQVQGKALVKVQSRADATHSGSFKIALEVKCNREANNGYPAGVITITELSMSDSIAQGTIAAVSLEQVLSNGKQVATVDINGCCWAAQLVGCRF